MSSDPHSADLARAPVRARWIVITVAQITMLALMPYSAHGDVSVAGPAGSMFSLRGFGSVGEVHSSEDEADFTDTELQANGAGHTRQWSPTVDSRLGLQITGRLISQLSAVVQVVSEQNADGTFRPHVEWANIKYDLTPDATIRLGRTLLPSYLQSDSIKVGYVNPWVRPPVELYSMSPVTNNDGVDASYRMHFGNFTNTVMGTYGKTALDVPGGERLEAHKSWLVGDWLEYGAATVHAGYQELNFSVNQSALDALFDALRQFGPQGIALAHRYDINDKLARDLTVGAQFNPGNWFVMGEWSKRNSDSLVGVSTAWYVSGGYRVEDFTPYVTYADLTADSNRSDPGLSAAAFPTYLGGAVTSLDAGLNTLLATTLAVQNTISAGTRWDFMKNVDVKVQYDHTRLGAGSTGLLGDVQPGLRPGSTFNLFSVVVDFVF
jgi:predicted porin